MTNATKSIFTCMAPSLRSESGQTQAPPPSFMTRNNNTMPHTPAFPAFGLQRRQLLGGFLAAGAVQLAPWALAAAPAATASPGFMALSRYLTERDDLNPGLAARLQAAWQELDNKFGANVDALWQWVQANQVALADLNTRIKAEKPELAHVPGQLMQAWWLGIAGSGHDTRVVAYEFALNAQLVAGKLRPPSYLYGLHGSWTSNPTQFDIKLVNRLS